MKKISKGTKLGIIFAMIIIISSVIVIGVATPKAATKKLTKSQQYYADTIARIAADNWEKYGVLPSVAVAQAFVESTLGDHCSGYNCWGIKSGAVQYGSLEEGTYAYLKVINNGYYGTAPFTTDYHSQLRKILAGGYCTPVGSYYEDAMWAISAYDFTKYDDEMFDRIERERIAREKRKAEIREAKRRAKWKLPYKMVYDEDVKENEVECDPEIIRSGAVLVYNTKNHYKLNKIYSVVKGKKKSGQVLRTSNKDLAGKTVYLEVKEKAIG